MPIRVRFGKNGFHHPAYGRLGRGKNEGKVYVLPDQFGEKETVKVPVMDSTSKPPRQIGEKEIARFKYLPSSVEIIDDGKVKELEDAALSGDEDAEDELNAVKAARMPKVATPEALEKVTGASKTPKAQDAKERTTGKKTRRASPRKPAE